MCFAVINNQSDCETFGDTASLFEAINEDELKFKLTETMEQMGDIFDNSDKPAKPVKSVKPVKAEKPKKTNPSKKPSRTRPSLRKSFVKNKLRKRSYTKSNPKRKNIVVSFPGKNDSKSVEDIHKKIKDIKSNN